MTIDIAEVARRSGVPASTLRFYEEKRLIAPIGRRGLRRLFDLEILDRLALIALGRAAGFSLDEVARMFAPDGRPRIDRRKACRQGRRVGPNDPQAYRDARRPAPCRGLSGAKSHGMPAFSPPHAGRGIGKGEVAQAGTARAAIRLKRSIALCAPAP
ncbi:DNA-binding transcriptional MerR regulator [Bradyrhizobium sp. GM7.3]